MARKEPGANRAEHVRGELLDLVIEGALPGGTQFDGDPVGQRQYTEIVDDVALLRRGLAILAAQAAMPATDDTQDTVASRDWAADHDGRTGMSRGMPRPRRVTRWVLAAAAGVIALGLAVGVGSWYWGDSTDTSDASGRASLTGDGAVACARLIILGRIGDVRPAGEKLQVTVQVSEYLKPANGDGAETLTVDDPSREVGAPTWPVGSTVLVLVPSNDDPPLPTFGAEIPQLQREYQTALDNSSVTCSGD